jgi:hypothetical protein
MIGTTMNVREGIGRRKLLGRALVGAGPVRMLIRCGRLSWHLSMMAQLCHQVGIRCARRIIALSIWSRGAVGPCNLESNCQRLKVRRVVCMRRAPDSVGIEQIDIEGEHHAGMERVADGRDRGLIGFDRMMVRSGCAASPNPMPPRPHSSTALGIVLPKRMRLVEHELSALAPSA